MEGLVDAVILLSVVLSLAPALRLRAGPGTAVRHTGRRATPLAALAAVTVVILLNQVLFTVYVLRVHGGDASFVARYLPAGWFDLATGDEALRSLARGFPAPSLLAPCVLRVQAFLELPFVLLAFATVLRWLDTGLYRRVVRSPLLPLAAASYTAVFCAVEWELRNPFTWDDIALRALSAVLTPPLMALMGARDAAPSRWPLSAAGLLLFIASLGSLGVLVLVVYDTALLYNLGRLDDRLPLAAAAACALAGSRLAARRVRAAPPGPAVRLAGHTLRRWLTLFLVPALAVRYGVAFGTPELAAAAGLLMASVAAVRAVGDTLGPGRPRPGRSALLLLGRIVPAVVAGGAAAYLVARLGSGPYYEATLLAAAAAFLVTAVTVCALTDAGIAGRTP
ncbi:hypothetical protein ACWCP6_20915 [Streptomyces sp. NPDC002004]